MQTHQERGSLPAIVTQQAAELAAARRELYGFLSRQLHVRPSAQAPTGRGLVRCWTEQAGPLGGQHLDALCTYLLSDEFEMQRLDREFSQLFEVPVGRYLAAIESVYDGGNGAGGFTPGALRGRAFREVVADYRAAGFELAPGARLEPDHMACELEFLAFLCDAERAAWAGGDAARALALQATAAHFIEAHPRRWIGKLRRRCSNLSSEPYYDVTMALIEEFLRVEAHHLVPQQPDS